VVFIFSFTACTIPKTATETTTAETTIAEITTQVEETETITKETAAVTTFAEEEFEEVLCIRVVDGDTIEIKDSAGKTFKVRYIGIDTPENGDNYFKEAKEANENLVLNKTIKMYKDVSETDKYGRLLRYIYVETIFINAYLVENGFAMASTYPPDVEHSDYFANLQNTAQSKGLGFWGIEATTETTKQTTETTAQETTTETSATETTVTETTQAPETTASGYFVGSKNSDVYHYPDCASAKKIKPGNLVIFNSVEEAKAASYRPCKNCNPPG
jgi:micrococcal nuclease